MRPSEAEMAEPPTQGPLPRQGLLSWACHYFCRLNDDTVELVLKRPQRSHRHGIARCYWRHDDIAVSRGDVSTI